MFGFCITHILNTGVLKFEKKIRRQKVKGLILYTYTMSPITVHLYLYFYLRGFPAKSFVTFPSCMLFVAQCYPSWIILEEHKS